MSEVGIVDRCRICGGRELRGIFSLGEQALTGVFPKRADAVVTSGPVDLVKCVAEKGCGLVQLKQSYDTSEMYGANYGYRSGLNRSMVLHLEAKVSGILGMGILRPGDTVIDVGSNDATTLRAYPEGRYRLVGIDPSGKKFRQYYPPHVELVPDFFSAATVHAALNGGKARVITSFSMFYDLEDPVAFAKEVEGALDDEGIWILEQSYLPTMLEMNSFDTVCHEHLEYYALKQIDWIAKAANLRVVDVDFNLVNGGSFSVTVVKNGSSLSTNAAHIHEVLEREHSIGLDSVEIFDSFRDRVAAAQCQLVQFLREAKAGGARVSGLGASTKGNVLLQYFGIGPDLLSEIGEVNPEKFGAFTPGTGIPLIPEDAVLARSPDYLLVLPWHFRDFFLALPKLKGRRLVFPLPRFEIVTAGQG